jgi:predicted methyltransferase
MEKQLRKLYRKFLKFHKCAFLDSVRKTGIKVKKKKLEKIFENYEKESFFCFVKEIKDVIYSKNIYDFILKNSTEDWYLYNLLLFLEQEKIISIKKIGKVSLLKKDLLNLLPQPKSQNQIKEIIEKKLKTKLSLKESTASLFEISPSFEYDQLPISISSALFLTEKILEYLPLNKTFLFVGDDDLVSIFLSLADPKIESVVIDIDENILRKISKFVQKYGLKIKTKRVNILKKKKLEGSFCGFLVNPVYTFEGIKKFLDFGLSQMGKDGGFVFLVIGDEAIGNRFLFLEKFFFQKN